MGYRKMKVIKVLQNATRKNQNVSNGLQRLKMHLKSC